MASPRKKVAVIVDGDNIPTTYTDVIIQEARRYGNVSLKNAYGVKIALKNWENNSDFETKVVSAGKNRTDMIIAFDVGRFVQRYKHVETFCIVSNDAHFVGVCEMLKESGLEVVVMGNSKAAQSLRAVSNEFINLDNPQKSKVNKQKTQPQIKPLSEFEALLKQVLPTKGQILLTVLKQKLKKTDPSFKIKDYGSATLAKLLKRVPHIVTLSNKNTIATRIQ